MLARLTSVFIRIATAQTHGQWSDETSRLISFLIAPVIRDNSPRLPRKWITISVDLFQWAVRSGRKADRMTQTPPWIIEKVGERQLLIHSADFNMDDGRDESSRPSLPSRSSEPGS
jgi:hypothetical protein